MAKLEGKEIMEFLKFWNFGRFEGKEFYHKIMIR